MAADIYAVGEVYTLIYQHENHPITVGKKGSKNYHSYPVPQSAIPYPVISAFSSGYTNKIDLNVSGTH